MPRTAELPSAARGITPSTTAIVEGLPFTSLETLMPFEVVIDARAGFLLGILGCCVMTDHFHVVIRR
jgi:hypothetical protein